MILQYFFKKENRQKKFADNTYVKIVLISKNLLNNNDYFRIKNYKYSFEIISFITIFYLKIYKDLKIKDYNKINEFLIENLINDLDQSLRENGIGDMSIGKYVKTYVKKFYYRLPIIDKILTNIDINNLQKYIEKFEIVEKNISLNLSIKILTIYNEIKRDIISKYKDLNY